MCVQSEGVTDDLKQQLRQQISNELLTKGIEKFIQSYQALSQWTNAALTSALDHFGWVLGEGVLTKTRPPIAWKVDNNLSNSHWMKKKRLQEREVAATSGRPAGQYVCKHTLSFRKETNRKHKHKLSMNISKVQQNAGKLWCVMLLNEAWSPCTSILWQVHSSLTLRIFSMFITLTNSSTR